MRITPKDIASKSFPAAAKGLDPAAVKTFLAQVQGTMEALIKDGKRMRRELEAKREQGDEISQTLILARRMTEDLKKSAREEAAEVVAAAKKEGADAMKKSRAEADMLLGEAHLEAQGIVAAHDERENVEKDIARLKGLRVQLLADVRAVIDRHAQVLGEIARGTSGGEKKKGKG